MSNKNITALRPHIGQLFKSKCKIYSFAEQRWIATAGQILLLLDVEVGDKFRLSRLGHPTMSVTAQFVVRAVFEADTAVLMQFPDGSKHWMYMWKYVDNDFWNCIELLSAEEK